MNPLMEKTQAKFLSLPKKYFSNLNKNKNIKKIIIYLCGSTVLFIILSLFLLRPVINLRLFSISYRNSDSLKTMKFCRQMDQKERVNWNYFYHFENKKTGQSLMWCKVPKAGSTTITKMLLKLAKVQNLKNITKIHKILRDHYPRLSNKEMDQKLKNSFKFLIVRDPFERILSAYRDKLEDYKRDLKYRDGYYHKNYGKLMTKRMGMSNQTLTKEPTFNEFVTYLIKTPVGRYDEHWLPITRLCSPCTVNYDWIIKLENFDKEIKEPFSQVGIFASKVGWSHRTGTHNSKIIQKYFKTLTLSDVKKLYSRFKKDFQLFGYTPYKYFRMLKNPKKNS